MKKITAISLVFLFLAATVTYKFNIGTGIVIALLLISLFSLYRGIPLEKVIESGYRSGRKSFLVIEIFFLVGILSAMWINSGTIPGIVYYGIKFMDPTYFYISAFIITSIVSFLLGSSFGTSGTIGIAMIAVGRGLGVDPYIAGGAIISGAYFGDRCSPVSSSANLVATLTETNLYENIKRMFKTSVIPFVITCIFYSLVTNSFEVSSVENPLAKEIYENFNLNLIIFLPVVLILFAALLKIKVKISIGISIISAFIVGFYIQNYTLVDLIESMTFGFTLNKNIPLSDILKGGGLLSMWKACLIVFTSCCISGIIDELKLLKNFDRILMNLKGKTKLFLSTITVSILTSALGCNQSIAVVMTNEVMKKIYSEKKLSKEELAIDIENTSILIPALIPWNIAGLIPATMMGLDSFRYIPYSFYLYLVPLTILIITYIKNRE